MMTSPNSNGQTAYNDEKGNRLLGSFCRVGFADTAVISYVKENIAFAMVYKIQRTIIWLTLTVLSISFLVNYLFSRSLSSPITRLIKASHEIEAGNFDIEISSVSNDEIGELTDSFKKMAHGLAEREMIKNAFGKFVNKDIAEFVLKNDIRLGGEKKNVVILFTDIRNFTMISEILEPVYVVELLNRYLTKMVSCIYKTHGVVDKYIGDSIMAVWGVPIRTDNDATNAVDAALMMRDELIKFNNDKGDDIRPRLQIGCGIHCGPVLAGQIGSVERMEYTVIGATVNVASRIESLNKPFSTDILISEETARMVKDIFRIVPMRKITVKGKTEVLQIYAVLGRLDNPNSPKTIEELHKLVGLTPPKLTTQSDLSNRRSKVRDKKYEILE